MKIATIKIPSNLVGMLEDIISRLEALETPTPERITTNSTLEATSGNTSYYLIDNNDGSSFVVYVPLGDNLEEMTVININNPNNLNVQIGTIDDSSILSNLAYPNFEEKTNVKNSNSSNITITLRKNPGDANDYLWFV